MSRYLYDPFTRPVRIGPKRRIRVPVRTEGDAPGTEQQPKQDKPHVGAKGGEETTIPNTDAVDMRQKLEMCQRELEAARAEIEEWKDRYLRAQAELDNTRKRIERRYADEAEREKENILRAMLPLADNLEAALRHANGADRALQEGVALTLKLFRDTLASFGVKPIETRDQPFDPNLHEAVGVEKTSEVEPGTVVAEEQTGYTYRDRLLRPARVRVSKGES
ncbi:MAG: nucleotide exchange factor GrpE [Anaerolineae bacterium]|nr:nucleotide exchange factor GrpE [Anaerolineae bacterium]